MKHYNTVLTIAGSDCSGGAGIQADIKAISALGGYAASAITAVTVQNTVGVTAVHPVPADIVEGQIRAVLDDIGAKAIKIGMLQSADIVHLIARLIKEYDIRNVVLDPVMVSTSGHRLIEETAISALQTELIPLTRVITPNIPEAEILLDGNAITLQEDMPQAVKALSQRYHTSVLLKAGHLTEDNLVDYFYDAEQDELTLLPSVRVHTRNTHGTGCTMSSAFATLLAQGNTLQQSAKGAKEYISQAIIAGADYDIGKLFTKERRSPNGVSHSSFFIHHSSFKNSHCVRRVTGGYK